jgi:hypothetical protein
MLLASHLQAGAHQHAKQRDAFVAATELHVPNRNEIDDYAERVLDYATGRETTAAGSGATDDALDDAHAHAASEANASYEEYVRGLDDVPTLRDVVGEPPRIAVRDFRLGERRDARKHARDDAYAFREQQASDLEQRYAEYVDALARQTGTVESGGARKPAKKRGRSKRPKRSKHRKA